MNPQAALSKTASHGSAIGFQAFFKPKLFGCRLRLVVSASVQAANGQVKLASCRSLLHRSSLSAEI